MQRDAIMLGQRYTLLHTLGTGGMASVFAAHDARLDATCAVKVLHPQFTPDTEAWRRFEGEARMMARIRHPNLVSVLDVQDGDGRLWIVMEIVEGGSLAERLEAHGPMPPRLACRVLADALAGLAEAHAHGIVHRDIKPDNLLFSRHGAVKVADFGIARDPELGGGLTRTGAMMGTPAFMAPEQRMSTRDITAATDIFCVGVTLLCALRGRPIVMGLEYVEMRDELFAGLPAPLVEVLDRATRFSPADRFADASEMRQVLLDLVPQLPEDPPDTVAPDAELDRSDLPVVPVEVAFAGGTTRVPGYPVRLPAHGARDLTSFVPRRLVHTLNRGANATGFTAHRFEGVALLADLSCLTALGRRHTARDGSSDEVDTTALAWAVDRGFEAIVDAVHGRGGELVELLGTTALAIWPREEHDPAPAQQALAAAGELVGTIRMLPRIDGVWPTTRVAVSAGPMVAARVGGHGGRWFVTVAGAARDVLEAAAPGEVVVHDALWASLEGVSGPRAGAHHRLDALLPVPVPPAPVIPAPPPHVEAYLGRHTLHRLARGLQGWAGELRTMTIVLARIEGTGSDEAEMEDLHATTVVCQQVVERWSGTLARIGPDGGAVELLAAFGLSTTGVEYRPADAAHAALELRRSVEGRGLRCVVSLASGEVYSALVGTAARCEHVLVGAPMDVAAHLVRRANGPVTCDGITRELLGDGFAFVSRGESVFEIHADTADLSERPLVGRQQLLEALEGVLRGEESRIALLVGGAGSGKTAILRHLERGRRSFLVSGDPLQLGAPYGALRQGLERLLGGTRDQAIDRLRRDHPEVAERAALLNGILGSHAPETSATADLHDFLRATATVELVVDLVRGQLSDEGALIVVDDAQWVDASSARVVDALHQALPRAALLVATRSEPPLPEPLQALLDDHPTHREQVPPLDASSTAELLRHAAGFTPPERIVRWVVERTGGQPLFVIETGRTLRGASKESLETMALDELSPPPTLEGAIAWRIDRLDDDARRGLEAASLLGVDFHPNALLAVHPLAPAPAELRRQLDAMARQELCRPVSDGRYQFVLPLAREVASEAIPEDRRIDIHRAAARYLAKHEAAPSAIAHHHLLGDEPNAALDHLERAADLAQRTGAVVETHGFLTAAVELDEGLRAAGGGVPPSRRGAWLRILADCAAALGRPEEARQRSEEALDALGAPIPRSESAWRTRALVELVVHLSHRILPDVLWRRDADTIVVSRERARALTRLSEAYFFLFGSRVALLGSTLAAVNEAERCLTPATATSAIGTLAMVANTLGLARATRHYLATTLIGATTSGPRDLAVAWFVHVMVHAPLGDWEQAEEASRKALPLLRSSDNRFKLGPLLSVNALNDILRGRYEQAAVWAGELRYDKVIDRHRAWGLYHQANIALVRGDAETARDLATRSRDLLVAAGDVSRITADGLLAVAHARCGDGDAAREAARELIERLEHDPLSSYTRLEGYAGPAEVYAHELRTAVAQGREPLPADVVEARRALAALKRYAKRYRLGLPRYWLLRGQIEAATGRATRAARSLTSARELARSMGLPCDEARATAALAGSDPTRAPALLAEAEGVLESIGARLHLRDAQSARRALEAA